MSYYFVEVPKLPKEISHQRGTVDLVEYAAPEGASLKPGDVIAIVENWWARMALKALAPGVLTKTFFERGTSIKEGDPLAIMVCDPEDGPRDAARCELSIIEHIRTKPPRER